MTDKVNIKEIFVSVQGEGPFVGCKQLFIRFCGCNLNCKYCDTNFDIKDSTVYSTEEILKIIASHQDCHSVSFTGGEPLLHAGFLKEILPQCPLPVYLETNATLVGELGEIIDYVDYVAADIKLPSCTGGISYLKEHDDFFAKSAHKELFAKVVFDENITENEITQVAKLGAKYGVEIILQPKTENNAEFTTDFTISVMDRFLQKYKKVRLIPQVHKFMDIR